MKNFFLTFFGIMFAAATFAQQDVVVENSTTLPYYESIDDVKLAMSNFKQKEILAAMKFQTPNFYKQFRSGQRLNRWGSGFILVGTGYFIAFTATRPLDFWYNLDGTIAVPITALAVIGGGTTMVCFGQKYKHNAKNSFATDIYNGKAHLTKNKFQPEFNLNFTGNGVGFLVNF